MSGAGAASPGRRGWRVAAVILVVCALGFSGWGILPLFSGSDAAEGPGPLPAEPEATVAGFGAQQPNWGDCGGGLQCADVYAPLDWGDPGGERITLRLMKRPATGGDPKGTLFVNPGGPGASGAQYVANSVDSVVPESVRRAYDVIGWDPRGVADSTPVRCYDAAGMDEYLFGVGDDAGLERGSDEWIAASLEEARAFGGACARGTGALLGTVDTASTVRDLDMLRAIAGDSKLNYLGFSYGTYIGARYADAYPERAGRMVLDGAMDPATGLTDVVREQTRGFERALRVYAEDCVQRRGCPFTGTADEAMASIGSLLDRLDRQPLRGSDGRTLSVDTMLTAIVTPLYARSSWGYLDDLFETVGRGEADVALSLADSYYDRADGRYLGNSTEAFSAVNCLDYPRGLDAARMRAQAAELDRIAPTIGRFQGYGDIACAAWPVQGVEDRPGVTAAGAGPILVVGTTGDPATPYRWAESLAQQLESGVLVTYVGEGHTAYGKNECVNRAVDDYLLTGAVPEGDLRCS
ncbi:alpha/beta hydrolase [Leucobacter sp. wl10]|uniref:alpha/beta hydrolase n=1 Tax=Leucobacter sp. wl10 TaxID=2304677 RepID=UPI000E5BA25E|nr:alpha/beta hydrolase [Leucobacter sp. wl10]RGE21903.1 alpha/beta hydrolase [Leucobacter sp. wl10]